MNNGNKNSIKYNNNYSITGDMFYFGIKFRELFEKIKVKTKNLLNNK